MYDGAHQEGKSFINVILWPYIQNDKNNAFVYVGFPY